MKPKFIHVLLAGTLAVWVGLGIPAAVAQQLRPEAQAGVLLSQARESMRSERWKEARESLEKILAIDIELPVTFHYQYALTLHKTGAYDQALERLSLYLNNDDAQADEFYNDGLRLFNDSQAALARQKAAEEQQRKAAVERARQLAAAEEAARQKVLAEQKAKQEAEAKAKREAETVERARQGAAQGDAEAQFALAAMYAHGQGVAQDFAEAVKWYRKAAEQNHVHAQNHLAWMYENGMGVTRSLAEAVRWYRKSADRGGSEAKQSLTRLGY